MTVDIFTLSALQSQCFRKKAVGKSSQHRNKQFLGVFVSIYEPARRAIKTMVPMFFCCVRQRPVIRLGSIVPSERKNCPKINTSVCLISRPSVHFGQNLAVEQLFLAAIIGFNSVDSRGDGLKSAEISSTSFFFSVVTAMENKLKVISFLKT